MWGMSAGRFEPVRACRATGLEVRVRISGSRGALGCSLRLLTNCANSAHALTFRESSGASTAIVRHASVEWHRSRWCESCRRQRDSNGPQFQWIQAIGLDGCERVLRYVSRNQPKLRLPLVVHGGVQARVRRHSEWRIGPQPGHESRPLSLRARAIDGRLGRSAVRDV